MDTSRVIIGTTYECRPVVISPENSSVLEAVKGNHLAGKSNLDVAFLYIVGQDLTYVPKGIENFLPNLKGIQYYISNLMKISADDLKPFPQLLIFYVHTGNLVSLDGNLFQYTLDLQWVGFFKNKIEHIGHNLLTDLHQLQHIHFGENVCTSLFANSIEEVKELNEKLPILCSPLEITEAPQTSVTASSTTTELVPCATRCSINREVDDLEALVKALKSVVDEQTQRIEKLEMTLRDLTASPCS